MPKIRVFVPAPTWAPTMPGPESEGISSFTGAIPYGAGVPFPRGELPSGAGVTLVDAHDRPVAFACEVRATWDPPSVAVEPSVKWLWIDFVAAYVDGAPPELYVRYGDAASGDGGQVLAPAPPVLEPGSVVASSAAGDLTIGPSAGVLGTWALTTWKDGNSTSTVGPGDDFELTTERDNGIVKVIRADADFGHARTRTRARVYPASRLVRMSHTVFWNDDAARELVEVKFSRDVSPGTTAAIGLTTGDTYDTTGATLARQTDVDATVWNGTDDVAGTLDGYISTGGAVPCFIALWRAAEQFPIGFAFADGEASGTSSAIMLSAPPGRIKLGLLDAVPAPVRAVMPNTATPNPGYYDSGAPHHYGYETSTPTGPTASDANPALVTPRGFAKTWELVLWLGDADVEDAAKNAFAQQPPVAHVDPSWIAFCGVTSPFRARYEDEVGSVEEALERLFFFTSKWDRSAAERDALGLLGWLHYGNLLWQWVGYTPIYYRYLMNQGKGWGALPWLLFARSGDPRFLESAIANARVTADACTCHVDDTGQYLDDDPPLASDGRFLGGAFSYSEAPWSLGPYGGAGFSVTPDSEHLLLWYYLTGDERARDVIRERVVCTHFARWSYVLATFYAPGTLTTHANRNIYNMLREFVLLYEAAWDDDDESVTPYLAELEAAARDTLDRVLLAQAEAHAAEGAWRFPGVSTNHYLCHALLHAARVLPDRAADALLALARWEESFLGRPTLPGHQGRALGPMAAWSLAALQEGAPTDERAMALDGLVRARAETILQTGTFNGIVFEGMGPEDTDEAGPYARDLLAASWSLARHPPAVAAARRASLPYVSSQMIATGRARHVVFVKKATGGVALVLHVHFNGSGGGLGVRDCDLDLSGPGGTSHTVHPFEATYDVYAGNEGLDVTIPGGWADGVYALDISMPAIGGTRGLLVHVTPSVASQLVHYVALAPTLASFVAPSYGGVLWFKSAGTLSVQGYFAQQGRMVLVDATGAQVAESHIASTTGGAPPHVPIYQPLSYTPGAAGLFGVVLGVVSPDPLFRVSGTRPYAAGTPAEWFDPNVDAPALVAGLGLPNA